MGTNECSQLASKSSWDSQDFGDVNMVSKMAHFHKSSRQQWVNSIWRGYGACIDKNEIKNSSVISEGIIASHDYEWSVNSSYHCWTWDTTYHKRHVVNSYWRSKEWLQWNSYSMHMCMFMLNRKLCAFQVIPIGCNSAENVTYCDNSTLLSIYF